LAFRFTPVSEEFRFRLHALAEEDSEEDQKFALEPRLLKEPSVLRFPESQQTKTAIKFFVKAFSAPINAL
jgi:hypothetical protein